VRSRHCVRRDEHGHVHEAARHIVDVPAGVGSMRVVAVGAKGGDGYHKDGPGGFGARVTADVPVQPGSMLFLFVGGRGGDGQAIAYGGPGGGGGASDVRTDGHTPLTTLDTRLLVAGGGGGGGRGIAPAPPGGNAGMPGGASPASRSGGGSSGGGQAGIPAGTGAGGTAGTTLDYQGQSGFAGTRGAGGGGAWFGPPLEGPEVPGGYNGGGGGGGGVFRVGPGPVAGTYSYATRYGGGGGGGGLNGGGGGGGSGSVDTQHLRTDIGSGGGGGGSNLVPAGGTATTDTTGEASITLSFADDVGPTATFAALPVVTREPPTLSGTSATGLGDGAVRIEVFEGATAAGDPRWSWTATRDERTGAWSDPFGARPDGQYTVRVTQRDGAGNVGPATTRTVVIDTAAPVVSLTSPASETRTNDATPTLGGIAGREPFDGETVEVVTHGLDGLVASARTVTRDGTTGAFAATPATALADGVYWTVAKQQDAAGNVGTAAVHWLVVDTRAPAPTLTTPAASASVTSPATIAGTGDTALGDVRTVEVTVHRGTSTAGAVVATLQATVGEDGGYRVDTPALGDGTYTARVRQSDTAGNTGTTTARTFAVDGTAPTVSLAAPASPAADTTPALTGAGGTGAGDVRTVEVTVHRGTSTAGTVVATLEAPVGEDGSFRVDTPNLGDGPTPRGPGSATPPATPARAPRARSPSTPPHRPSRSRRRPPRRRTRRPRSPVRPAPPRATGPPST
jgi:hypothetical protein